MNHPRSAVKGSVLHGVSPTGPLSTLGQPGLRGRQSTLIVATVAAAVFNERRLAEISDPLAPDRPDLEFYLGLVAEFGARSVVDIGCGTGTFACLLANRGVEVIAVDPAAASLDVARTKSGAEKVR